MPRSVCARIFPSLSVQDRSARSDRGGNAETGRDRISHMREQLGSRTVRTIANGSRTLAIIWQSAWNEGTRTG